MTSLYTCYIPITLILEFYVKWSNLNIEYNFAKFLLMSGHDLEMSYAKF